MQTEFRDKLRVLYYEMRRHQSDDTENKIKRGDEEESVREVAEMRTQASYKFAEE